MATGKSKEKKIKGDVVPDTAVIVKIAPGMVDENIETTIIPPVNHTLYEEVYDEVVENGKKYKVPVIYPVDPKPKKIGEIEPGKNYYAYVRILIDKETKEYLYEAIEPQLTPDLEEVLDYLENAMLDEFDVSADDLETPEMKKKALRATMNETLFHAGINLDRVSMEKIFYYLYRDFIGYGKIHVTMMDPFLEDVSCDGSNVPIYVYHKKYLSIKSNIQFDSHEEVNRYVVQLGQKCGKHISKANPVLDATIPDGSRLNATLGSEVTTRGSTFTIRRFKENPLTVIDLVNWKAMNPEMAAFLWLGIQHGSSIMCAGGTASGKTTTLNAVALFIPPLSKIVTIEDTREINIPHENWIPGLTREVKEGDESTGAKNVDMFELLKAAMRQRPDYMIVGEVRGKETMTVFQAMSSGQTVFSTLHADSVASVVHRLENPPINIPRILVLSLNFVLLQAQVRVENKKGQSVKTRRIKQIAEILDLDPETNHIRVQPVFTWTQAGDIFRYSGHSKFLDKVAEMENMSRQEIMQELKRRETVIKWLWQKHRQSAGKDVDYKVVFKTVQRYTLDPEEMYREAQDYLDRFGVPEYD